MPTPRTTPMPLHRACAHWSSEAHAWPACSQVLRPDAPALAACCTRSGASRLRRPIRTTSCWGPSRARSPRIPAFWTSADYHSTRCARRSRWRRSSRRSRSTRLQARPRAWPSLPPPSLQACISERPPCNSGHMTLLALCVLVVLPVITGFDASGNTSNKGCTFSGG